MMRAIALLAAAAVVLGASNAQARRPTSTDPVTSPQAVVAWNQTAQDAILKSGKFQTESLIYMSFVQAAVYNSVTAIEGGYEQYKASLTAPAGASLDAAVAAAAHDVLVHYFPAAAWPAVAAVYEPAYVSSLAAIPDGRSKTDGIALGQAAAALLIAQRSGDVLSGPGSFTFGTGPYGTGPGAWLLQWPGGHLYPPGDSQATAPQTPWAVNLQPFMLRSTSQFRPEEGPPPLTSERYAHDLNQIKAYGGKDSALRTPEQTETGLFWTTNVVRQYNQAYRDLIGARGLDAEQAARLIAMGNLIGADVGITCLEAKYRWAFWRPVNAIRGADTDGNPATAADPNWLPMVNPGSGGSGTPNHPEFPAAHGCLTSAESEMFASFLHTRHIGIDLTSTVTNTTRHFDTVGQMTRNVMYGRLYAGFHYWFSSVAGVRIGREVADYAFEHYFQPTGDGHDDGRDD